MYRRHLSSHSQFSHPILVVTSIYNFTKLSRYSRKCQDASLVTITPHRPKVSKIYNLSCSSRNTEIFSC